MRVLLRGVLLLLAADALAADRGPVTVRVVGPSGTPLPGVKVAWYGEGESEAVTGEDGSVVLPDLPHDGSVDLYLLDGRPPVTVTGPQVTIRAHNGHWCEVTFVDAETGDVVEGVPWTLHGLLRHAEPRAARRRIAYGSRLDVEAPDEYVLPKSYVGWSALRAHELRAVVPLRRAVCLELRAAFPGGKPAAEAKVTRLMVGGREEWKYAYADTDGTILVDIPFFRDEEIRTVIEYEYEGKALQTEWTARLPHEHQARMTGSVVLSELGLPQDPERESIPAGTWTRAFLPPPDVGGTLELRAFWNNGLPAVDVPILLTHMKEVRARKEYTDEHGAVRFDRLEEGTWLVDVLGGFLGGEAKIDVRLEEPIRMDLREPSPGAAVVSVVDEQGRPVPFAEIEIVLESPAWDKRYVGGLYDVVDGVQRLDPYTDRDGTRHLARLRPGPLTLRATYGARTGEATCIVKSDETVQVRIVVEE